ncbi:Multidrug resistance protein MdtA [Pandoraea iniqua]|uniref:efflux RND transporter periplasmic adaptor subunit n=1 Tax=Pandoraea iniqua TaxID=2508288 RepID=UPI0012426B65|nr:efflux RND transporter periplasmic adaptor subunit [Pandoraea iniqua]VVE04576.1 Multidrug resistance protein MdtA [Pandoraea iniqua]
MEAAPDTGSQPPKKRRRTGLWIGIVVLVLVAWVAWHLAHRPNTKRGAQPQIVSVAQAAYGEMPVTITSLGTVTPEATVTVLPQLSGYLTQVGYQEGQEVTKGQFLAQIDPRQYEISKAQAQAQLAKDRAALAQAKADLARYTQLHQQKSIAEQTFADQQFLVAQDEAAVKADLANIAQFDLDLTYCRITAPVAGRVGLRLVDAGNYVTSTSTTGIAVITSVKPTTVEFTVAQNALPAVMKQYRTGKPLAVTAFSSDNKEKLATGALYAVSNQMATSTGTVTLRARFANDDEVLFPQEFVNVTLLVDTLQHVVLVPTPAVQSGAPGEFVYVATQNNTASLRKVTIGPSDGKHTVITSGLNAGETVVTDGMDRLSDGAHIALPNAATPASGAAAASETGAAAQASGAGRHGGHRGASAPAAVEASGASGASGASATSAPPASAAGAQ